MSGGRLWDRGETLDERVARFTVGRDPELDRHLVAYDALASAAHATMLQRIGVLRPEELEGLLGELRAIATEARQGTFAIAREDEDGHTALENRLTAQLGDTGRRIHTGRSRNDQVIAALRLFGRERVVGLVEQLIELADKLLALADEHRETAVPGYTHTRQAMPSTLGLFFAAHAEGLLDMLPWMRVAFDHLDRSPLGSASGYGVALPLDRQLVSELLAFRCPQINTLAVQNDRGKSESLVMGVVAALAADLGRLASDLIWFSSDELAFVALASSVTTGSSIMPQKRNPDVLELVRATAARLRHRQGEIAAIYAALPSGYHRDLQLGKEPFVEGLLSAADLLAVMLPVLETLRVDHERCRAALRRSTGATDEVYRRVREGTPFRTAYRQVAADAEGAVEGDVAEAWRLREHLGAPPQLELEAYGEVVAVARRWAADTSKRLQEPWQRLGLEQGA